MGKRSEQAAQTLVEAAQRAVAAHLRAERARAGMKQTELAKLTGLSANTISRLETGERSMTLPQLVVICAALGITPGEFLDTAQNASRRFG